MANAVRPAASTVPPAQQEAGHARLVPGLVLVFACVGFAFAVHRVVPSLSPLVVSVVAGVATANLRPLPCRTGPGIRFAGKRLLRLGVVLLGFQLAVGQVLDLGPSALGVVVVTVAATFFGTQWLARRMGLSRNLGLLVAVGFSICGASAIAATSGVAEADEEDVAFSIALVTLCGSLAILLLPLLRGPLGLSNPTQFGSWAGASVHDVGQVVATAAVAGHASVKASIIVKLTRVVLLAPMVAAIGVHRRAARCRAGIPSDARRPPLLPLFVVGFLAAVACRSSEMMPEAWLRDLKGIQDVFLAAGLVALGTGVRLRDLRRLGVRPLVLGLAAWLTVGLVSYIGVVMIGAPS